jgi:hypothetical protein
METGSFFSNLISAPFRAISGLISGVFNSLWTGVLATAGITATKLLLPDLWRAGVHAVGGQALADKTAKEIKEKGVPGVIANSALEGFGLAAAFGGAKGMWDGATNRSGDTAGGLGSLIGAGVAIAVVGSVALGAIHKQGVSAAGEADNSAKTPPATPQKTEAKPIKK